MAPIAVGAAAPDFTLRDQHGVGVASSQLRGRPLLLVFFPFAFSPVCSGEIAEFSRRQAEFDDLGASVLAISCDPVHALRAWSDQAALSLPLLSDFWPHGHVAAAYGCLDADRGAPRRCSVLIDTDATVRWTVQVPLSQARSVDDHRDAVTDLIAQR